jgi:ribosomal protein S18 acetylase RimI-like enzyme
MSTSGRYSDRDYHHSEAEFRELLGLLSVTYPLNGWLHNWSINRMGDWNFGGNSVRAKTDPNFYIRNVHIWEHDGKVIGFNVAEYGDLMFLQVHPHHRAIEPDMVRWTEGQWATGRKKVTFAVYEVDAWRQSVLAERGYHRGDPSGVIRKYDSYLSAGQPQIPPGFRIMTLSEFGDEDSYIEAVRTSFGRDMLDRGWFDSKVKAPGYSHQWNLCLISPQNRVVSFADVRIDRKGGYAEIDPIGTVPGSQRQGLARSLLREGFRRLAAAGIRDVHIGSAPPPNHSNRLYDSLGPVLRFEERLWEKEPPHGAIDPREGSKS